jgi:hypothetical protein
VWRDYCQFRAGFGPFLEGFVECKIKKTYCVKINTYNSIILLPGIFSHVIMQ